MILCLVPIGTRLDFFSEQAMYNIEWYEGEALGIGDLQGQYKNLLDLDRIQLELDKIISLMNLHDLKN